MFHLIFCALCAQKFWRVRTFSRNSPRILCPKPKRFLCPKLGDDQKKGLHPKSIGFCIRKVHCGNFMINNKISVQEYVCVQQIFLCAQSLKSVCLRTRAQLRRNTDPQWKNKQGGNNEDIRHWRKSGVQRNRHLANYRPLFGH